MNALEVKIERIFSDEFLGLIELKCAFGTLSVLLTRPQRWERGARARALFKQTELLLFIPPALEPADSMHCTESISLQSTMRADCILDTKPPAHTESATFLSADSLLASSANFPRPVFSTTNCFYQKIARVQKQEVLSLIEFEGGICALISTKDCLALESAGLSVGKSCAWVISPAQILLEN